MELTLLRQTILQENLRKQKLLVYDTSRGVASEIRKKMSSQYDIHYCLKKGDDNTIELNNFFAAIIIINDLDDIEKIEKIKLKIKNLIVSSSLKKSYFDFSNLNNLVIFDLNLTRKDTISLFLNTLDEFEKK